MINVLVINECGCILLDSACNWQLFPSVALASSIFIFIFFCLSLSVSVSISSFIVFLDSRAACYRNLLAQCGYCASNLAAFVASVCCLAAAVATTALCHRSLHDSITLHIAMKNVYHIGSRKATISIGTTLKSLWLYDQFKPKFN